MMIKEKISSLQELISHLELKPAYITFGEMLSQIDFHSSIIENYSSWNKEHYTRNLLFSNEEFEIILACFQPGQKTNIHNYGHQQGWGIVLSGDLTEIKYIANEQSEVPSMLFKKDLSKGDITYINDYHGMHQFVNNTNEYAVSLHLLLEKVDRWQAYDSSNHLFYDEIIKFDTDFSGNKK